MANILILSAGTRNKVVQYFKKSVGRDGRIIAADMSLLAPAIYEADNYYQVPRITDEKYLGTIFDICRKEQISGVLSLIDPELSLLALHEEEFLELGVKVIGSNYDLCERSLNKYEMFQWLRSNNYKCAKSYIDWEEFEMALVNGEISFPVFVKPASGSASINISVADNKKTAEFLFNQGKEMMIQEFLHGQEIGADVYIDMISGEVVSIFTKKKIVMRAGETDKSVSFKDDSLFELIKRFVKDSGYRGQIDIDIFEIGGEYYISEVNPRFGGGYPHAYECGCDHMRMILNNLNGVVNHSNIGAYENNVYMMKYNEIMITR